MEKAVFQSNEITATATGLGRALGKSGLQNGVCDFIDVKFSEVSEGDIPNPESNPVPEKFFFTFRRFFRMESIRVVVTVLECANSHQFSLPFQGLVGPAKAFSIRLPFIGMRSEIGVWPDAAFVRCAVADPDILDDQ